MMVAASKTASKLKSFGKVVLCLALGMVLSVGLFVAVLYIANVVIEIHLTGAERAALATVDVILAAIMAPSALLLSIVTSVVALVRGQRPVLVSALAGAGVGILLGLIAIVIMLKP